MPRSSETINYETSTDRKLLLFDLFVSGHHPGYILHLVKYWREQNTPGNLDILVTPKFKFLHLDVINIALENNDQNNIRFLTISLEEEAKLKPETTSKDRRIRAFQEWNLLDKYISRLKPTKCVLMYFDSILLSFALKRMPCPLSAIYFRPIFHYSQFVDFTPSIKERFLQLRDKLLLKQVFKHSDFQTLFCLDPYVIDSISKLNDKIEVTYLPDPVQIYNDSEDQLERLVKELGVHPIRTILLMFGVPQKRKGIDQLLEAINLLPSHFRQKLCLLIVGPLSSEPRIKYRIEEISKALPLQVIIVDEFVPDQKIQPYFQISDVILAPYQRHIGMSAILVRAAAALKPVLSSNYGLMGEIVRRHQLGVTVNSSIPEEIAKGIRLCLTKPVKDLCNYQTMKEFAEQNSAKNYASTIFDYLEL